MNDEHDGVSRLFRAIDGLNADSSGDHDKYLGLLPALVEAEIAGEDIAALFPDLLAHLDTCVACDAEYATLLELAMAEARGEISQPSTYPPLRLPRQVAIQQLVRRITEKLLKMPDQVEDLAVVLQTFFEQANDSLTRLTLEPTSALVMGLSGESPEPLPKVMASYYALNTVLEKYSAAELQALDQGALEQMLRKIAHGEAKRHYLQSAAESTFVETFVREVLANLPTLLEIASQRS